MIAGSFVTANLARNEGFVAGIAAAAAATAAATAAVAAAVALTHHHRLCFQ